MKWIWGLLLVFLVACGSQELDPVIAQSVAVEFGGCEATQSVGETCTQDCECLVPGDCIKGVCSLTKLEDGKPCAYNRQCLSGYCTQTGHCGGPDGGSMVFRCEKECEPTSEGEKCYTTCRR